MAGRAIVSVFGMRKLHQFRMACTNIDDVDTYARGVDNAGTNMVIARTIIAVARIVIQEIASTMLNHRLLKSKGAEKIRYERNKI